MRSSRRDSMRRLFPATLSLVIASAAFALATSPVRAQEHEHQGAMAGCACCQKSGTAAENPAAGCCDRMAAMNRSAAADPSAMKHDADMTADAKPTAKASGC